MYRPPTEGKKDFHTRCHSQPLKRGALEVSFEVAKGWNAVDIASELNRIAFQGMKIEDYRSYATEGGAWGISIYTEKAGTLFILEDSGEHDKVDAFFRSVRYGGFRFTSATADGQAITLTRER
jgi:hypothetical protein